MESADSLVLRDGRCGRGSGSKLGVVEHLHFDGRSQLVFITFHSSNPRPKLTPYFWKFRNDSIKR